MLQVYTPFTAPLSIEHGGFALAGGISHGLDSLAENISRAADERKRQGQLATSLRKTLKIAYPNRSDQFDAMSLGDLQGTLQGEALKSAEEQRRLQLEEMTDRIARSRKQETDLDALSTRIDELRNSDLSSYYEGARDFPGGRPPQLPITPQLVGQAAVDTRTLLHPQLDNILNVLDRTSNRGSMMGPEALAALGFIPSGGQLNPNGSASITFSKPQPKPTNVTPIPTTTGAPSGIGWLGGLDKVVDLPTEKSRALTDAQANALQFSERMKYNNEIIHMLEQKGFKPASTGTALQNLTPGFMNPIRSDEFQQYDAARDNWIAAVLRKESGAAISQSEYANARKQYFPAFGDSPKVIAQKAALRLIAEQNMRRAIGEGIEPNRAETPSNSAAADQGGGTVRTYVFDRATGKWVPK